MQLRIRERDTAQAMVAFHSGQAIDVEPCVCLNSRWRLALHERAPIIGEILRGGGAVAYQELRLQIQDLIPRLTTATVKKEVRTLLRQGEDTGGGVNALRFVRHLLGKPNLRDAEATWAYDRLKPALRTAFAQIPSLYYFEGD